MKMTGIAKSICLAAILLVTGCQAASIEGTSGQELQTPPTPAISWQGQSAVTVPTSSCWSVGDQAICKDTAAPPEIIGEMKPAPLQVKPGAIVTISFTHPPAEKSLVVNQWVGTSQIEQTLENGTQWKAPEQPGWYMYDVRGEWEQGDAGHAFVIEVKSNSRT
jgi:hypothetical protein